MCLQVPFSITVHIIRFPNKCWHVSLTIPIYCLLIQYNCLCLFLVGIPVYSIFIVIELQTFYICSNVAQVLIPVANGSEEIEIVTIVDILRRAKLDVVVASIEKSVQILASRGTKIIADKLIGDAAESIYDLIILPVRQMSMIIYPCFIF